jgi:hypothetical protein
MYVVEVITLMEEIMEIAKTISSQIFIGTKMELGYHKALAGSNFLSFNTKIKTGYSYKFKVTLNEMDTYTVELFKSRKFETKLARNSEGVYAENLNEVLISLFQEEYENK